MANKLSKYASGLMKKRKEEWLSEKFADEGIAATSAVAAASLGAFVDKRFGDPVTGVMRVGKPESGFAPPVNGILGGIGIAAGAFFPDYPGREPITGAAVGLACESLTLFIHRTTRRPDQS